MIARLLNVPLALSLAILWLLALGAGAQLPAPLSYGVLALVLITFWACHLRRDLPRGWHGDRVKLPSRRWWLWGGAMALTLCAWRLCASMLMVHVGWLDPKQLDQPIDGWLLLAALVAAPLIEEVGFRLWLQGALERVLPFLLALPLAAAAFAMAHDPSLWVLHFVSALTYGVALRGGDSLWLCVFMHALANTLLAVLGTFAPLQGLWTALQQLSPPAVMVSLLVLSGGLWIGARIALARNQEVRL